MVKEPHRRSDVRDVPETIEPIMLMVMTNQQRSPKKTFFTPRAFQRKNDKTMTYWYESGILVEVNTTPVAVWTLYHVLAETMEDAKAHALHDVNYMATFVPKKIYSVLNGYVHGYEYADMDDINILLSRAAYAITTIDSEWARSKIWNIMS